MKFIQTLGAAGAMGFLTLLVALVLPVAVQAQGTYPSKPVRLIVGFPPGQATDVIARLLAQKFSESLGQSVLVDNKPGKGGSLGAELAAKSAADGYTPLLRRWRPIQTCIRTSATIRSRILRRSA
jgi:tripartite-type tricarboxylate transporter receptor subunit TctC